MLSHSFDDLVSPLTCHAFLVEVFGREPRHFRGAPERFDSLFGWETLDSVLSTHRLEWPRLRIFRNGKPVPEDDYSEEVARRSGAPYRRLRLDSLTDVLASGATLVLDRVDQLDASVCDLTMSVEAEARSPAFVNLYASWGDAAGFDLHWDDHDVFTLQLQGSKTWTLHQPTRPSPLFIDIADTPPPLGECDKTIETCPGEVLYIPHGWWHAAIASSSPSLHLTIGLNPESGIDYLNWVTDQLRASELFRTRLPRFASTEDRALHLAQMNEALATYLNNSEALLRFYSYVEATAPARIRLGLPDAVREDGGLNDSTVVTLLAPRAVVSYEEGAVTFAAASQKWILRADAADVLRLLTSQLRVSLADLRSAGLAIGVEAVDELIRTLVRAGVVVADGG